MSILKLLPHRPATQPGDHMTGRVFESFPTQTEGHSVGLRWSKHGILAACSGCPDTHGPTSQHKATEWAVRHALKCHGTVRAGK